MIIVILLGIFLWKSSPGWPHHAEPTVCSWPYHETLLFAVGPTDGRMSCDVDLTNRGKDFYMSI